MASVPSTESEGGEFLLPVAGAADNGCPHLRRNVTFQLPGIPASRERLRSLMVHEGIEEISSHRQCPDAGLRQGTPVRIQEGTDALCRVRDHLVHGMSQTAGKGLEHSGAGAIRDVVRENGRKNKDGWPRGVDVGI